MVEIHSRKPSIFVALRALRHRNYRLFFFGQSISLIGTWMQRVAVGWLVYRLTGSEALLGLEAFLTMFPSLFMSPIGGVLADRYDRRRLLYFTQISIRSSGADTGDYCPEWICLGVADYCSERFSWTGAFTGYTDQTVDD